MGQILRSCTRCATPFQPRHPRHRHCPQCEPHGNDHRSPTTRTRPSSSTKREAIRQEVLARDPRCMLRLPGCTGDSTVADHIVAAADGGRYEPTNLRGACHHCNSVRGGQHTTSSLEHGSADRPSAVLSAGGEHRAPVGPTRLA